MSMKSLSRARLWHPWPSAICADRGRVCYKSYRVTFCLLWIRSRLDYSSTKGFRTSKWASWPVGKARVCVFHVQLDLFFFFLVDHLNKTNVFRLWSSPWREYSPPQRQTRVKIYFRSIWQSLIRQELLRNLSIQVRREHISAYWFQYYFQNDLSTI